MTKQEDKDKFKQTSKEIQDDLTNASLVRIAQHIRDENFREAELELNRLIQDLRNLILVRAVADK